MLYTRDIYKHLQFEKSTITGQFIRGRYISLTRCRKKFLLYFDDEREWDTKVTLIMILERHEVFVLSLITPAVLFFHRECERVIAAFSSCYMLSAAHQEREGGLCTRSTQMSGVIHLIIYCNWEIKSVNISTVAQFLVLVDHLHMSTHSLFLYICYLARESL